MYRPFFRRAYTLHRFRRHFTLATISSGTLFLGVMSWRDSDSAKPPLSSLVRAYTVYTMCSIPFLVDHSPQILHVLSTLPVLKQITEAFVRATFFNQFVGGDSAQATIPLVRALRAGNKGALLGYSAEVDLHSLPSNSNPSANTGNASYKHFVDEIIRSIDAAAEVEDSFSLGSRRPPSRHTWVAIKLTALAPAHSLFNYSKHIIHTRQTHNVPFPGCPTSSDLSILYSPQPSPCLTREDIDSIRELHAELERVCAHAKLRGVKVIIDAEYSWYQPAIDALQLSLMRKYNRLDYDSNHQQAVIYGTWQAYLRRNPQYIEEALQDARRYRYALGVKLVRGAYHTHEVSGHAATADNSGGDNTAPSISTDAAPPVWMTKAETDECYHESVRTLIRAVAEDASTRDVDTNEGRKIWWPISRTQTKVIPRTPRIGVLFATHNRNSCDVILEELVKARLAKKEESSGSEENGKSNKEMITIPEETLSRVAIAQLYGMSNDLTDSLVAKTKSGVPLVMKYVPYGSLSEVLPYLGRRATENKSILGEGAGIRERERAWALIRARLTGSD